MASTALKRAEQSEAVHGSEAKEVAQTATRAATATTASTITSTVAPTPVAGAETLQQTRGGVVHEARPAYDPAPDPGSPAPESDPSRPARSRPGGKIALIGTHGVGKTILTLELASHCRKRDVDADVAYENSRRSPFPINEETTLEGQMWILAAQWKIELEASLRSELVICDRSVLDNYAYMIHAGGRQDYLHPFLERWLDTYDLLVHVPIIDGDAVADGTRSIDRTFRLRIDGIVSDLIAEFGCRERTISLPLDRSQHIDLVGRAMEERGLLRRVRAWQGRPFQTD